MYGYGIVKLKQSDVLAKNNVYVGNVSSFLENPVGTEGPIIMEQIQVDMISQLFRTPQRRES